jgi:two-component sensor histidine kinase
VADESGQSDRTFPLQQRSVALARRFVSDALDSVAIDQFAAELLVSELATNAVEHARSPFTVSVSIRSTEVRIAVSNDAPELLAVVTQEPTDKGGFGLQLVDKLSQLWGTLSTEGKKTVWFQLARADAAA